MVGILHVRIPKDTNSTNWNAHRNIRESLVAEEYAWRSCTPLGSHLHIRFTLPQYVPLNQPSFLPIYLSTWLHIYATYSTFRISKTLNHLSMLSRACLATLCFRLALTLGDAKRCNNYRFVCARCTFVFLRCTLCPGTLNNDRTRMGRSAFRITIRCC